jgi:sugar phosphate isomerase/epimerase
LKRVLRKLQPKVIETLKKIDYQGYVSAEILPLPDSDTAARITAETLDKIGY